MITHLLIEFLNGPMIDEDTSIDREKVFIDDNYRCRNCRKRATKAMLYSICIILFQRLEEEKTSVLMLLLSAKNATRQLITRLLPHR